MQRIGFGARLGAGLIDGIIMIVLSVVFGSVFGTSMLATVGTEDPAAAMATMFSSMAMTGIVLLAYTTFEIFKAASPGKMALGLVIRNADGTPADQNTLIKRWATKQSATLLQVVGGLMGIAILVTLSGLAGLIIFIGCFMVLGESKQALHDKVAKTAVFKK